MKIAELIESSVKLEKDAQKIQQDKQLALSDADISRIVRRYDNWYAECLSVLPDTYSGRFIKEYEGGMFSPGIKKFLDQPGAVNMFHTPETANTFPYWMYPYTTTFQSRLRVQRQILLEVQARQAVMAAKQEAIREGLQREIIEGYVFIAMPMSPDDPMLDDVHDAIKLAGAENQLDAERVDDPQSNERITDRILEALATAEYVVADLTHGKPNVYFEAGYAQALGKIPIYIAREGTQIEFDLKDYPILFFRNIKELRQKLHERFAGLIKAKQAPTISTDK